MKTVSQILREFGAKVVRTKTVGYYIYEGKNFTASFNEEYCETSWWEIDTFSDETSDAIKRMFQFGGDHWQENRFELKRDVVRCLYQIDRDWE